MHEYTFRFEEWSTMCNSCFTNFRTTIKHSLEGAKTSHKDAFPERFNIGPIDYGHNPQEIGLVYYYVTVQVSEEIDDKRIKQIKQIWNDQYIIEAKDSGLSPTGEWITPEKIRPYRSNIFVCASALAACILVFFSLPYALYILPAISVLSTLYSARQFIKKSLTDGDMMSRLMSLGLILAYANMAYMLYPIFFASITMSFPMLMMAFLLPMSLILMANFINYIMLKMSHQWVELKKLQGNNRVAKFYEVYTDDQIAQVQAFDPKVNGSKDRKVALEPRKKPRTEIEERDIVRVNPGIAAPVGGIVVCGLQGDQVTNGASLWDTSVKDGEIARVVNKGGKIAGGAINLGDEPVLITAQSCYYKDDFSDTVLRVNGNPTQNNEQKEIDQRFIANGNFFQKYSRYLLLIYFLTMFALAILLPYLFAPSITISLILTNVINILFSTCPCAMSIALLYPNIALLSKLNHYYDIKETKALSKLKAINTIIFDKTGTLTANKSTVVSFFSTEGEFEDTILPVVTALENQLGEPHPIGRGISLFGKERIAIEKLPKVTPIKFKSNGISGIWQDKETFIGNEAFIKEQGCKIPENYKAQTQTEENQSLTPVYVAQSDLAKPRIVSVKGVFLLRHELRGDVLKTLRALKKPGDKEGYTLILLSGDKEGALTKFKEKLLASGEGEQKEDLFDEIISADTPQKKQAYVEKKIKDGKNILSVADGFNDVLPLRYIQDNSNGLGIAIEQKNPAAQVADIILKNNSLYDIVKLFQLKDINCDIDLIIKHNFTIIFFFLTCIASFVVTASIIGLAIPPTLMVVLMLSSTLSIYFNSHRTHFIVDNQIGERGYLTQFLASPYFLITMMIGALLILVSLQAQLILTGHMAVIAFVGTSTSVMSACFLVGACIISACLVLFAFQYIYNLSQQQLTSRQATECTPNENTDYLSGLCKHGIYSTSNNKAIKSMAESQPNVQILCNG